VPALRSVRETNCATGPPRLQSSKSGNDQKHERVAVRDSAIADHAPFTDN
jgi:hypothetical protein